MDRRRLLLVYDVGAKRLRVEVGPRLEGSSPTDSSVSHAREHRIVFASPGPGLGLRLTLRIIHMRMRVAALGETIDTRRAGGNWDMIADAMNSQEFHGRQWTYGVIRSNDDYMYAFADMMDDYGYGMFRGRDADNRPLPVHERP